MYTKNIIFPCISWESLSLSSCPRKKCFWEKNTIFPDDTKKIMSRRGPFWKHHLFRKCDENIVFPCVFWYWSSFIFRLRCKIIVSEKRNMIVSNNTRKTIFQCYFFGKTIFSGPLKKENMVFHAVEALTVLTTSQEKLEAEYKYFLLTRFTFNWIPCLSFILQFIFSVKEPAVKHFVNLLSPRDSIQNVTGFPYL